MKKLGWVFVGLGVLTACGGGPPEERFPVTGKDHAVLLTASDFGLIPAARGVDPQKESWSKIKKGNEWILKYQYLGLEQGKMLLSEVELHENAARAKGAMLGMKLAPALMLGKGLRFEGQRDLVSLGDQQDCQTFTLSNNRSGRGAYCGVRQGTTTYLLIFYDASGHISPRTMDAAMAKPLAALATYTP